MYIVAKQNEMRKLLSCLFVLSVIVSATAQTDFDLVKSTVTKNDIKGHIYFLASDELRGRETGSPEIDIAASYLANSLRRYGVKPAGKNQSYYQNVALEKVSTPKQISLLINELNIDEFITFKVNKTNFKGDVIYLNFGLEEDYKNKNVKGKLIITKTGDPKKPEAKASYSNSLNKAKIAKEKGAIGLIELSNLNDKQWNRYSHYFNGTKTQIVQKKENSTFIHLWVKDVDKKVENILKTTKPIEGSLNISESIIKPFTSRNIIGIVEGSDPKLKKEYIIYSAHYDHNGVGKPNEQMDSIYNGARDNAVGTVTVLNVAENIAKYPTKRSALFILFTGEEKGLLGSKWYVNNPVLPLKQMVYCFNSDNGGYNDITKATIIGLNRTTASKHIKKAASLFGLEAIDDPAPEQGLFDRSDNVHFAAKGIPAPTYSMGFIAFDEEIFKYYHQVTDNPDTLDYDYLLKFFQSYVLSSRLIANDVETPFWVKGDKYYKAGKDLYNMK